MSKEEFLKLKILIENYYLFCVFDGHGDDGEYVSKACKDFMPIFFKNYIDSKKSV